MFDLLAKPLLWIPVIWDGLAPGEGEEVAQPIEHRIDVQVEILDRDAFTEWLRGGTADAGTAADADDEAFDPAARAAHELASFKAVASNWRKVVAGGAALPFNDENVALMLRVPGFVPAFGQAYVKAFRGQAEERVGNSESSPNNGRADAPSSGTTAAKKPRRVGR